MAYETIIVEKKDRVATITLNRPPMNPLNRRLYEELGQASEELNADPEVKVVIITGAGDKAFAAGLDVKEVEGKSVTEMKDFWACSRDAASRVAGIEKPVIAAINGLALGGGLELALCCDLRIASEETRFGQPEVTLGIIPGGGGTQRLPRLIGPGKAKELIFMGRRIPAREALDIGLVNQVHEADVLLAECQKMAETMTKAGPIAIAQAKYAIDHGLDTDLDSGLTIESEAYGKTIPTADRLEGLAAFREKRTPVYKGK